MNKIEEKTNSVLLGGVEWSKTYGGDESDRVVFFDQAGDDGYFSGGSTEESNTQLPWLIKTDSDGNEEWSWEIIEVSNDTMTFPIVDGDSYFGLQSPDGGYVACLHMIFEYESENWHIGGLVKLNAYGGEEWLQYYAIDWIWTFIPVSVLVEDDGFLMAGVSWYTAAPGDARGMLLKTDFMGVEQWRQEYQYGDGDDQIMAVYPTSDDGYILSGWADDTTYEYWMIKTDGSGNEEWNATFGGNSEDFGHSRMCYQTNDGGYIMTGYSYSFGAGQCDAWIVKTDSSGNLEWDKTYGESQRDVCWSMENMDDDGYVVCVTMNLLGTSGDKADIHLVKINEDGNIEWITEFGGAESQIANHVQQTSDDGFITAGRNGQYLSPTTDAMLVKFSAQGPNNAPNAPEITGPTEGIIGEEHNYNFTIEDPDDGELFLYVDWGDEQIEEWIGPYLSGDTIMLSHTWDEKGDYVITAKVKDVLDAEGPEGTLEISMPKNNAFNFNVNLLEWLFERFPNAFPMLRLLLGL